MTSPAFQFYPDDFLGSPAVRGMSASEVGVYLLLLCLDWNGNGFKIDPQNLVSTSRACNSTVRNFKRAWLNVGGCFALGEDGRYRNPRLQRERAKQFAYSARMAENGKKGGRPKAVGKPRLPERKAVVKPNESIPFPSPTPTLTTTTTTKTTTAEKPTRAHPSWLLPSSRVWEAKFGAGSFPWGEFGRHCNALSKAHDGPTLAAHLGRYLAKTETQFTSPARFAKTFGEWRSIAPSELVDEYGCLTELGDKLTRPA